MMAGLGWVLSGVLLVVTGFLTAAAQEVSDPLTPYFIRSWGGRTGHS